MDLYTIILQIRPLFPFLNQSQQERKLIHISGEMLKRNCNSRSLFSLGAVRAVKTDFNLKKCCF